MGANAPLKFQNLENSKIRKMTEEFAVAINMMMSIESGINNIE